jgi:hypothetical protein
MPALAIPSPTHGGWPTLPLDAWRDTYATLHMWTQMVGKTKLALAPPLNHWWHVTLITSARGLTTGPLPLGRLTLDIEFDFIDHALVMRRSDGARRTIPLRPQSVAAFFQEYEAALATLGVGAKLWPMPVEVEHPIRFTEDEEHAAYDPVYAQRWWTALTQIDAIFRQFRGEFLGKSSPSHFFWGSFDLAVTRFSGRRAPERPEADAVTREAYSHEVISAGFWPGSRGVQEAAFYAYAAPEPAGFRDVAGLPEGVTYDAQMGLFILPYDAVRTAPSPTARLREFLESTYAAGANLAHWDRAMLERQPPSGASPEPTKATAATP